MIGFYAGDPIYYRHAIRERFHYDPMEADPFDVAETVYHMLTERVNSDFGLFRGEIPPKPDYCDYSDSKKYSDAEQAWVKSLCKVERWTRIEQLDGHLAKPLPKVEEVMADGTA